MVSLGTDLDLRGVAGLDVLHLLGLTPKQFFGRVRRLCTCLRDRQQQTHPRQLKARIPLYLLPCVLGVFDHALVPSHTNDSHDPELVFGTICQCFVGGQFLLNDIASILNLGEAFTKYGSAITPAAGLASASLHGSAGYRGPAWRALLHLKACQPGGQHILRRLPQADGQRSCAHRPNENGGPGPP